MTKFDFSTIRIIDKEDHYSFHVPAHQHQCEATVDPLHADVAPECGTDAEWMLVSERYDEAQALCVRHVFLALGELMASPTLERVEGLIKFTSEEGTS